jgi:hypothetical protein
VLEGRELGKAFGEPGDHAGHRRALLRCLETGLALERGASITLGPDE